MRQAVITNGTVFFKVLVIFGEILTMVMDGMFMRMMICLGM
jgi:hypothetical protein